jgi:hypothetical protein
VQLFLAEHPGGQYLIFGAALVVGFLPLWFLWRAFRRAGLPEPLALLALVPGGIFVALGILAFADWPALRRTRPQIDRMA